MSTSQPSSQASTSPFNWSSLIQLVLSALAAFLLMGAASLIVVTSAVQYFSRGSSRVDPTQSLMIAASLTFAGVLVLPSAWYAWKHLAFPGLEPAIRPERRGLVLILTLLVLVIVAGALLLGNWVSQNNSLAWLLLPPLNIIATGLPALWLVYIGTRGLIAGLPRRRWGVFATGLVLSPMIILVLELLVLVGIGVLAILWAVLDPSISNQLNSLVFRLQNSAPNMDAILRILLPFLLHPGILFIAFAFVSVIVPLIEEALKPIGVWFLAGQKLTPAQGFGYGILSGAGFGLFENLGNTSGGGEAWAILASTRITTLLLHCLTAGLVGWALASAWGQKRYLRLGITYAVAVLIHGFWNGMAVLSSINSLEGQVNISIPASLQQLGGYSSIGIIALGAFNLVLYVGFSAVLRNGLNGNAQLPTEAEGISNRTGTGTNPDEGGASTPLTLTNNSPSLRSVVAPPLPASDISPTPSEGDPPANPETNS